ncbi:hypothetical protein EDD15DRAFT_2256898 [Pisolithus albus]|nr:hypothetical protein EDD15DRAFT_2256898 [Pisolithus albus]
MGSREELAIIEDRRQIISSTRSLKSRACDTWALKLLRVDDDDLKRAEPGSPVRAQRSPYLWWAIQDVRDVQGENLMLSMLLLALLQSRATSAAMLLSPSCFGTYSESLQVVTRNPISVLSCTVVAGTRRSDGVVASLQILKSWAPLTTCVISRSDPLRSFHSPTSPQPTFTIRHIVGEECASRYVHFRVSFNCPNENGVVRTLRGGGASFEGTAPSTSGCPLLSGRESCTVGKT